MDADHFDSIAKVVARLRDRRQVVRGAARAAYAAPALLATLTAADEARAQALSSPTPTPPDCCGVPCAGNCFNCTCFPVGCADICQSPNRILCCKPGEKCTRGDDLSARVCCDFNKLCVNRTACCTASQRCGDNDECVSS